MRYWFGISTEFAGDGAGVCREVMPGVEIVRRSRRNGLRYGVFPAPAGGGSLCSSLRAFFDYAVKFLCKLSVKYNVYLLMIIFEVLLHHDCEIVLPEIVLVFGSNKASISQKT